MRAADAAGNALAARRRARRRLQSPVCVQGSCRGLAVGGCSKGLNCAQANQTCSALCPPQDKEAAQLGLVEEVVPPEQLLEAAKRMALDMAGAWVAGRVAHADRCGRGWQQGRKRAGSRPRPAVRPAAASLVRCLLPAACRLCAPTPCLPPATVSHVPVAGRRARVQVLYRTDRLEPLGQALAVLQFARAQVRCSLRARRWCAHTVPSATSFA